MLSTISTGHQINMSDTHPTSSPQRPSTLEVWWQAIRPKTLGLAISPVLVGTALAWSQQTLSSHPLHHMEVPAVILLCAVVIQIGTNLFNDAQDFANGTDGPGGAKRLGPARMTALGWALPHHVSAAGLSAFLIALLGGLHLIGIGGWPIFFLGLSSLGAGYLYSHGPYPISHSPFGEVVVIAFFGVFAVAGTFYLQTGQVTHAALMLGVVLGLPAGGVLLLNNVRDREGDIEAGRRTVAIRVGVKASRILYGVFMIAPSALLAFGVMSGTLSPGALCGLATLPLALKAIRTLSVTEPGPSLNVLLAATVKFQGLLALTTAAGLLAL